MSSDGWAYWTGSFSMLEGHGYVDLEDRPILAWPPLFSAVLAGVQSVLGVSGFALVITVSLLTAITVLSWSFVIDAYRRARADSARISSRIALVYVSVVFLLHTRDLRSEALAHVFLPWMLYGLLVARNATGKRRLAFAWALIAIAMTLGLLTRNSFVAYAPAVAALWFMATRTRETSLISRSILATLLFAVPVATWHLVRTWLGQAGAFEIDPTIAKFDLVQYAYQAFRGVGRAASSDILGQLLLAGLAYCTWRRDRVVEDKLGRAALAFAFASLLALMLLFSLTYIEDPLTGRFVAFVPMIIGACGCIDAAAHLREKQTALLAILLLAVPGIRVLKHAASGRQPGPGRISVVELLVPMRATLDRKVLDGDPVEGPAGSLIVAPPRFPWQVDRRRPR